MALEGDRYFGFELIQRKVLMRLEARIEALEAALAELDVPVEPEE